MEDLLARLKHLPPAKHLHFFELLAHNLTIPARSASANPTLSPEAKVEALRRINEVLHEHQAVLREVPPAEA